VVGSAIQAGKWLPEAVKFITTHKSEMSKKKIAIFSDCMTLAMKNGENYRSVVSEKLTTVRALIHPINEGIFAGGLDIKRIQSISKRIQFWISVKLGVWSEGDHRNWDDIRTWSMQLVSQLK
jgi:menaquinone-dependent protoporphyrinogen IX oxidase